MEKSRERYGRKEGRVGVQRYWLVELGSSSQWNVVNPRATCPATSLVGDSPTYLSELERLLYQQTRCHHQMVAMRFLCSDHQLATGLRGGSFGDSQTGS